jgi:hypothetical protein
VGKAGCGGNESDRACLWTALGDNGAREKCDYRNCEDEPLVFVEAGLK